MSKFTQGKWKIEAFDIVDEYHIPIAQIPHIGRREETVKANLKLITAAPEMYELLCEVADELGAVGLPTLSNECYELLARIDCE